MNWWYSQPKFLRLVPIYAVHGFSRPRLRAVSYGPPTIHQRNRAPLSPSTTSFRALVPEVNSRLPNWLYDALISDTLSMVLREADPEHCVFVSLRSVISSTTRLQRWWNYYTPFSLRDLLEPEGPLISGKRVASTVKGIYGRTIMVEGKRMDAKRNRQISTPHEKVVSRYKPWRTD